EVLRGKAKVVKLSFDTLGKRRRDARENSNEQNQGKAQYAGNPCAGLHDTSSFNERRTSTLEGGTASGRNRGGCSRGSAGDCRSSATHLGSNASFTVLDGHGRTFPVRVVGSEGGWSSRGRGDGPLLRKLLERLLGRVRLRAARLELQHLL